MLPSKKMPRPKEVVLGPIRTAKALAHLHEQSFGGRGNGRYRMGRPSIRRLTGKARIHDAFLEQVDDAAANLGYTVINFGEYIVVMSVASIDAMRRPPAPFVKQARSAIFQEEESLEEANDNDEEEEDDKDSE